MRSTDGVDKLRDITEKEFLGQVIDLARLMGWEVYHVFEQSDYARRTTSGFPDLVLVRPPRIIFAELKRQKGKLTDKQMAWLRLLEACSGWAGDRLTTQTYSTNQNVATAVWRPDDFEQIAEVLKGETESK